MSDDARYRDFTFTPANEAEFQRIVGRYPKGREHSAIMPLLWVAQYQMQAETGIAWLPLPVIEYVADRIGMPHIRALEVATFTPCST